MQTGKTEDKLMNYIKDESSLIVPFSCISNHLASMREVYKLHTIKYSKAQNKYLK